MKRRCFMCDCDIDTSAYWGFKKTSVAIVIDRIRRFVVYVCLDCLAEFKVEDYWHAIEQMHCDEGRDINVAP